MTYENFLESKRHISTDIGINATWLPGGMFDFQKYVAEYGIKKGRCADFLDTGTGKTLIELVTAYNFLLHTNKPVLILTPLAVAFQFIKEAEKFGINDVSYCKDGKYKTKIVITNYERLHYFNPNDFECLMLDESSILKNFEGATKEAITTFIKKIHYRFLFTATPSPNDYIELGTSSEALGYMGYMDMLGTFFKNNQNNASTISQIAKARQGEKWYLKPHAVEGFFQWVSTWSISMRKPSDLGFSDDKFILPELKINYNTVENKTPISGNGQLLVFDKIAKNRQDLAKENNLTINERCELAVSKANEHETSVYWCNLNAEGDLLAKLDKSAVQISGSMDIDQKEEILLAFSEGKIKKLITKAKMTAFGLNWQHCGHTCFFPTYSYEQWYQAIRRFWRFGRTEKVVADIIISKGQQRMLDSLLIKSQNADALFSKLNSSINAQFAHNKKEFKNEIQLPKWLSNN